ncbi:protein DOM34 [Kluyveromyces marxianus]|uniref:Protein DOM34 homolog n=2 Tax=Kluyveromyces marxianus TaxID=4911 RepID=W0T7I9_KLUMD|nr:protein DOM34 [Kluyveromyces marxianus DMKU3-1042]QGN13754.1 protein DOM34 [Kluyveromyces marxianus]BAO38064.1 protein DOM34 [Kluyveromyces marxianus DMKU3-1042]BAP69636.1 protein DOM34 [Kluyveromyces marxianus]
MKLINKVEGSGTNEGTILTLLPQDKEDLFTLYNIINTDDEIIFKKKVTSKTEESGKKKTTQLEKLRIRVVSSEFEPQNEFLRYKGVTTEDDYSNANQDMPIGKFFSFTIDFQYPFTLIKSDYNSYVSNLIKEACNIEGRSDMAAVVLQEGIAHICLMNSFSTVLKHKVEYSIPKKKRATDIMKFDDKVEKFYKATYESMLRHFDFESLKCIILCSPGFYAKTLYDKILNYARETKNKSVLSNSNKFLVAHCSTGYLQGIDEVLKNPAYKHKLEDVKNSKEVIIMDEFLDHLNKDDFKAWYGEQEITKAAELAAIDTLLISDSWMRSDDVKIRQKSLNLVKEVEQSGGKAYIFSSLHNIGEELDRLTGIACILKYPIPDLDEDIDDVSDEDN